VTATGTLARAGLVVSGAFFVSRVLGWFRLVVFAQLFSAS
jgi:peptidoglycan biosynthesis protein MviN/MurJ (putative lipid II flippase)